MRRPDVKTFPIVTDGTDPVATFALADHNRGHSLTGQSTWDEPGKNQGGTPTQRDESDTSIAYRGRPSRGPAYPPFCTFDPIRIFYGAGDLHYRA